MKNKTDINETIKKISKETFQQSSVNNLEDLKINSTEIILYEKMTQSTEIISEEKMTQ